MADALGTGGSVVSALDHRLDNAGLIAAQSSTLAVRTGVMHGPGTTALVTGTSATGTMTYSIAAHHWVSTRGTADGVYLGTKEATATVATGAAPGSNSRIDIIWSKQQDAGSSISPDGSTAEQYGVTQGTAAVSPTAPTIPVGAVELARAVVAAGATSTNGAGVTITNTALQTVARGAPIPVRNQAERDALTGFPGLTVKRLDVVGCPNETWDGTWYSERRPYRQLVKTDGGTASSAVWTRVVGHNNAAGAPGNGTGQITYTLGVLTVPLSGRYRGFAKTAFAANATGERRIRVVRNGSGTPDSDTAAGNFLGYGIQPGSAAGPVDLSTPIDAVLNAGDTVEVQIYQNSGAALGLTATTGLQAFHLSYEGPA